MTKMIPRAFALWQSAGRCYRCRRMAQINYSCWF